MAIRRENLITCGAIMQNGELLELRCDPTVGEVMFEDELNGASIIGELSIVDPIGLANLSNMPALLKENELLGAIYTKHGFYAITSENVAELRPLGAITKETGDSIAIDLNVMADIEDNALGLED